MRIFYHATDYKNLCEINNKGLLSSFEGIVYLAETEEDAVKFVALRGYKEILVIKVKVYEKDKDKIIETFDHNHAFFNCKAFGYMGNIPSENLKFLRKYINPYG